MKPIYYTYDEQTKSLARAGTVLRLPDRTIVNPSADENARYAQAYQKGEDAPMPEPPEGKVAVPDGYALGDDKRWHRQWRYEDAPPPAPRTFDKYRLVDALMREGVWTSVKEWLQAVPDGYDRAVMAPDISEDEPLLAQGVAAAKEAFGWDDAKVESILARCAVA